jgi:transcriptional regulator with XRE-family HTH domain
MDITSDQAADLLKIKGGSLRQIETGHKPASLALAFRAERLYGVPVDELLAEDKPKDKPKKDEPKIEKVAPDRRTGKTGPRRVDKDAA